MDLGMFDKWAKPVGDPRIRVIERYPIIQLLQVQVCCMYAVTRRRKLATMIDGMGQLMNIRI